MACSIIKRMADGGCTVGTIHADNDATTTSRLPTSIKKKMIRHMLKRIFQSAFMGCLKFIKT